MITALDIDDLTLVRGERRLFKGLRLTLAAGEAVALTGRNGSGKTSLLRATAGLLAPAGGTIRFSGVEGEIEPEIARGAGLHMLGHLDGLKAARTAIEELTFQARWTGGNAASAVAAAERLGLGGRLNLPVRKLSAGQRRRLALARLLASPRALWLLDEPLAPLDAEQRRVFGAVMQAHLAGGGLILAAVHDPLPIAARNLDLAPWTVGA